MYAQTFEIITWLRCSSNFFLTLSKHIFLFFRQHSKCDVAGNDGKRLFDIKLPPEGSQMTDSILV